VNIFLKITGIRENYHTLASRFVRIDSLYDTLAFGPKIENEEGLELIGNFSCLNKNNTITKAFNALSEAGYKEALNNLSSQYALHVTKRIPEGAGLGGGSSDAATFLHMCNEMANLGCTTKELADIGQKVGADVPFFVHGLKVANVSGIGEIIEPYEESVPLLELLTPPFTCNTKAVYEHFRANRLGCIDLDLADEMFKLDSHTLLTQYDAVSLNDLMASALSLYPQLAAYIEPGWCMSGSGSTLFRIKNG
jgi:4-diphosphocytidyl-2-C-methyl-D-erythritol kinase